MYWDHSYEDMMNLVARLPEVAALIYRCTYFDGKVAPYDTSLDYSGNFCQMLGMDDKGFHELMRCVAPPPARPQGLPARSSDSADRRPGPLPTHASCVRAYPLSPPSTPPAPPHPTPPHPTPPHPHPPSPTAHRAAPS